MDESFTPEELAKRFKCSARHIRSLAKSGELESFKVGELYRFTPEAVAKLMKPAKKTKQAS